MSEKILVPVLGESITEATVTKWLKKKGDNVVADEAVVELETDKVNLEVPAPASGVISEINSKDGDTVEVGTVLGMISEGSALKEEKKAEPVKGNVEKNNVINLEIEKSKVIEEVIIKVIKDNPNKVKEYKSGKVKLFGFFVGQVMKTSGGKANPQLVNEILKKKL